MPNRAITNQISNKKELLPNLLPRMFVFILDVEEITHKAGNFKKFSVFTRMLGGALTEENDSVLFVDLLTYSDLELLKARKSGNSNVGYSVGGKSGTNSQAAISNKRYVILTYSG